MRNSFFSADVKEEEVLKTISQVNKNDKIHGVLLFRPLPKHLNEDRIVNALAVEKDVDGITDLSMAGVFMGKTWDTHHVRQVPA